MSNVMIITLFIRTTKDRYSSLESGDLEYRTLVSICFFKIIHKPIYFEFFVDLYDLCKEIWYSCASKQKWMATLFLLLEADITNVNYQKVHLRAIRILSVDMCMGSFWQRLFEKKEKTKSSLIMRILIHSDNSLFQSLNSNKVTYFYMHGAQHCQNGW